MLNLMITGKFRDTLKYKSLSGFDKIEKRAWQKNQIQDSAVNIIVPQVFGMYTSVLSGFNPVNYFALGSGSGSWDADPNNVNKPYDQTTLTNELSITNSRKAINDSFFTLLDVSTGNPLNPQSASSKIKLNVTIDANEGLGTLREFGLFGNATATVDSGIMLNWITHPSIEKDEQLVINREIVLDFTVCRS